MATHVVQHGSIIFVFQSCLEPYFKPMNDFLSIHGDAVKDVAFTVDDCRGIYKVWKD